MKKTIPFLMFLCMMAISLTQSCHHQESPAKTAQSFMVNDSTKVHQKKDTLAIYLVSVVRKDAKGKYSYHLSMFDENGDCGIDDLTTVFYYQMGKSGKIQWKKTHNSEIKKIILIKCDEPDSVIFQNGAHQLPNGEWYLDIPPNINIPADSTRTEKYTIKYTTKIRDRNKDTTIIIDPYLRVPE